MRCTAARATTPGAPNAANYARRIRLGEQGNSAKVHRISPGDGEEGKGPGRAGRQKKVWPGEGWLGSSRPVSAAERGIGRGQGRGARVINNRFINHENRPGGASQPGRLAGAASSPPPRRFGTALRARGWEWQVGARYCSFIKPRNESA